MQEEHPTNPNAKATLEAALFSSAEPITLKEIADLAQLTKPQAVRLLEELKLEYITRQSGIEIISNEDAYSMRVRSDLDGKVSHLITETDMPQAMLKVLAIIAVEEPMIQSALVKLRGNRTYTYLDRLEEMELILRRKKGKTKEIYTTPKFRQYFHIEDPNKLITKGQLKLVEKEEPLEPPKEPEITKMKLK
ncbi:Segregation and condensation protein B [uncultured archaeon]|nr:Segregation and condensation protein B [uncultured archaeon]